MTTENGRNAQNRHDMNTTHPLSDLDLDSLLSLASGVKGGEVDESGWTKAIEAHVFNVWSDLSEEDRTTVSTSTREAFKAAQINRPALTAKALVKRAEENRRVQIALKGAAQWSEERRTGYKHTPEDLCSAAVWMCDAPSDVRREWMDTWSSALLSLPEWTEGSRAHWTTEMAAALTTAGVKGGSNTAQRTTKDVDARRRANERKRQLERSVNARRREAQKRIDSKDPETRGSLVMALDGREWEYGECVSLTIPPRGLSTEPTTKFIAQHCYPLAQSVNLATGMAGVLYRFHTADGSVQYGTLSGAEWTDASCAAAAGIEAARNGVQIGSDMAREWAFALGQWRDPNNSREGAQEIPKILTSDKAGWVKLDNPQRYIYINGPHTADRETDSTPIRWEGSELRTQRRGTLEEWQDGFKRLCTSRLTQIAVGTALAGALVERLGIPSFMVHFGGASSSGKSIAADVGGAVWYDSDDGRGTYHDKPLATMHRWGHFNGACALMDELKDAKKEHISQLVHTLNEGRERARLTSKIKEQRRSKWSMTLLSSGEKGLCQSLGEKAQGGHSVRVLDIPMQKGEAARDGQHADDIKEWRRRCYGVAGDAWVDILASLDDKKWDDMATTIKGVVGQLKKKGLAKGSEEQRIAKNVVVVCIALNLAHKRDLLSLPLEGMNVGQYTLDLAVWMMKRINLERGHETTPEGRAWSQLQNLWLSSPSHFPTEKDYKEGVNATVYGIQPDHQEGTFWTTEGMLSKSEVFDNVACGVRNFLAWAVETGKAKKEEKRQRHGGKLARWYEVIIEEEDKEEV